MTDLVLCVLLWWGVGTAMHGQFHFFFLAKGPQLLSLSVAPRMKITAWNISHHHRTACGHAGRTTLGRPHECEVMRSNVLLQGPLRLHARRTRLIFFPHSMHKKHPLKTLRTQSWHEHIGLADLTLSMATWRARCSAHVSPQRRCCGPYRTNSARVPRINKYMGHSQSAQE